MDKTKSGCKQPRKFDLIQIHELYNKDESEEIQLKLAGSHRLLPRSSVDDIIESVIPQAYEPVPDKPDNITASSDGVLSPTPAVLNPVLSVNSEEPVENPRDHTEKTYCICKNVAGDGEMIGCDNLECSMEWFHFKCVNITRAPRGKWYCSSCSNVTNLKTHLKKFCPGVKVKK